MPIDQVSAARRTQGAFQNRHHGAAPASHASRKHAAWGQHAPALRVGNHPAQLLTAALLLTALLPAAQATPTYTTVPGTAPPAGCGGIRSIGNAALGACALAPRSCAAATMLGTLGLFGGLVYLNAQGGFQPSHETWDSRRPLRPVPPHVPLPSLPMRDHVQQTVQQASVVSADGTSSPMEAALLQVARDCGGDRGCRAEAINALLHSVPPATLSQLQQMVARTVAPSTPPVQEGWPLAGAEAAAWPADTLLELADVLAGLYTPSVAAFQDDMEFIVASTASVPSGRQGTADDIQQRWRQANERRLEAIARLLERDAGPVTRVPYVLHGLEHLGIADGSEAFNLQVTLPTSGQALPVQRLLLVAHGDMIGRARGSEGAYDNASGVATLLHIARQMEDDPSLSGTQVDLLVTSNEELGFLGARAYVDDCLQRDHCPTFVINVDMTGRGGHGYALTGTDGLAGSPHLGKPTMYLQAPAVSAMEHQARAQLEQRLAAQGFVPASRDHGPWITSDNIAFQNASIPCVAVTQVSAADAALWRQLEDARTTWQARDAEVDWHAWQAQRSGTAPLPAEEARILKARYQAATGAYAQYRALRDAHPNAPPALIHSERDRLHRVNPVMAVDFADALLDGVRHLHWEADVAGLTPTTLNS